MVCSEMKQRTLVGKNLADLHMLCWKLRILGRIKKNKCLMFIPPNLVVVRIMNLRKELLDMVLHISKEIHGTWYMYNRGLKLKNYIFWTSLQIVLMMRFWFYFVQFHIRLKLGLVQCCSWKIPERHPWGLGWWQCHIFFPIPRLWLMGPDWWGSS